MPKTIGLPDDAAERVLQHAAANQISLGRAAADLILGAVAFSPAPPVPVSVTPRAISLAEAAEAFMAHMPAAQVELIRDLCLENSHTPAEYLLSYTKLAYERGETATYIGDDLFTADSPAPAVVLQLTTCGHCAQTFTPVRRGQVYCSDDCGRTASIAEIRRKRAEYLSRTRPERTVVNAAAAPRAGE